MKFLQFEVNTRAGDVIEVTLQSQANVRVMDASNLSHYRSGRGYRAAGGLATKSPVRLTPPRAGRWYVVVDRGGVPGVIAANVRVI